MPVNVLHFEHQGRVTPIPGRFASTAALLRAVNVAELAGLEGTTLDERQVKWLSPVTRGQQFVCQGANYRQHMISWRRAR